MVLERAPHTGFNLLKCDVQGAELDVIRGASHLLEKDIQVVLLELSFLPYNEGAPLASRVISSMSLRGLFDIAELHYWTHSTPPVVGQADFVFARRGSVLFERYGAAMRLVTHESLPLLLSPRDT